MLMTQQVKLHCHKKLNHVRVLCGDGKPSSEVQRMYRVFCFSRFVFEFPIKPTYKRNSGVKEVQAAWRWRELSGLIWQEVAWNFIDFCRQQTWVHPGCQHTPQAQKSFEICKQARHFNHQIGEINKHMAHIKSGY